MTTYWAFFCKSFKKNAAYRSEVWLRIVAGVVSITIQVAIWRALLGAGSVDGITLEDMVTYAIVNGGINVLLFTRMYYKVDERLRTGDIAVDLLKPLRYPAFLFADELGRAAFQLVFTVAPTLVIATLLFGFSAPASPAYAVAFALALVLSLLVSYAIGYLIALLAFWFLTTFHFSWAIGALTTVFSGSFLPLWFFPDGWQTVARTLPFQFLGFVPAAIYMGQFETSEVLTTLLTGVAWAAMLLVLTNWLWTVAIRRLVVQGG